MNQGYRKYRPFQPIALADRTWPGRTLTQAPVWCSVDLRDGNQALVTPMNLEQKVAFFRMLTAIGFREIEVGFPASSETEFEILRTLIEGDLIPEGVTIQVLVQAREHLIRRTFQAIRGAKDVIVHFYNSTSTLQRKVVFETDMQGVIDIAVEGARLIRALTEDMLRQEPGMSIRYEYSPESFSGTEVENSVGICDQVLEALGATPERKAILNLPNTVELCTPNTYADQVEYVCRNLRHRDCAVISVHPHNDRGTAVAATELALMAGAQRVEGTLFGNGERTGNVDIMTLAMNLYSQGVDPGLDFSHMAKHGSPYWEVPYLPIDPADLGRQYEPIVRINSQSGKGGAAFVMRQAFGYQLPRAMHPEFGALVKEACERARRELSPGEVFAIFRQEYLEVKHPYHLLTYRIFEESGMGGQVLVDFEGVIRTHHVNKEVSGRGNGPIDAFFNALRALGLTDYEFVSYSEHAVSAGADSKAVSYIQLRHKGKTVFGVGMDHNISIASVKGILCAINRSVTAQEDR